MLAGHLTSLASNVRFYKPLSALLSKLVTTDSLLDILAELEEELVMLACHRFGYTVVVALLEAELPPATQERLVANVSKALVVVSILDKTMVVTESR